jgi:hypothetical protein
MTGFHPLMTFGQALYEGSVYQNLHFVGTSSETTFRQTFPNFANSYSTISADQKALYHSLCVLGGNGTTLLWSLIENEFEKLGLPRTALAPYLQQVCQNQLQGQPGRWTGPWYRQDNKTIEAHHKALLNTPLQNLYKELEKLSQSTERAP